MITWDYKKHDAIVLKYGRSAGNWDYKHENAIKRAKEELAANRKNNK